MLTLTVPSLLSLLRWKLCRCSVQIQRQHILQWSAACSNPRCECVSDSCVWFLPIICPSRIHTLHRSLSLSRVFSQRTKRSSSTTPSWLFYRRRLSCRLLTPSWRAISRPSDGWWPPRLASRLSPSCLSKNAAVIPSAPRCLLFLWSILSVELLVTGMLCHSKVWSRVWSHRCNVNMNPYISVCPFLPVSYPSCSSPESFLTVCRPGPLLSLFCFHLWLLDRHFRREVMSLSRAAGLNLSWPSLSRHLISHLIHIFVPPSLSHYLLCPFYPLHFCIPQYLKNQVAFPGHWDVWEELYLLFLTCSCEANEPWLVFLERFIARVAWCFPSQTQTLY